MSPALHTFLEKLKDLPGFENLDFSDINAVTDEGENALHVAVRWNDVEAIKLLLAKGINVSQPGDLGHTPLHEACMAGSLEMVTLLVDNGADLFALTEGYPPFTMARSGGHDHVCDYLAEQMKKRQKEDPGVWIRARIRQLQSEISRLERRLETLRI
jgi:ankyrin repeat protein